jgi:membrane protease YdiL (CAAX protease family)
LDRRRVYLITFTIICYFFALPLGVLIPLSSLDSRYESLYTIGQGLIIVGLAIILIYLAYKIIIAILNIRRMKTE